MLRRRHYGLGPFALEEDPHTHTGPRTYRLYLNRYDLLILASPRLFLINTAAFVDCDGHIAINKNFGSGRFAKVVELGQKNRPFLDALGVQINLHIDGIKLHRAAGGSRRSRRMCSLSYHGHEAELLLTALVPFIFWKHQKALWLSLEATAANEANYKISHDYSTRQRRVLLAAMGGRDAVVNDWGFRGSTQLDKGQYIARAMVCFQESSEMAC